jgi:hypothetical protein
MAQRIDEWPKSLSTGYPWDEWLDGSIWKLKADEDFKAKVQTFRSNAGTQARKRGGKIRSRLFREDNGDEYLIIQFRSGDDNAE